MVHPYKVKQSQLEMILIHMDAELPLLKLELGLKSPLKRTGANLF
jgi:hypothetical protein